jgi:hypothetical protein
MTGMGRGAGFGPCLVLEVWGGRTVRRRLSSEKMMDRLLGLGRTLDTAKDKTAGVRVAEEFLWVRDREGATRPLVANHAQREFEAMRGQNNIVLKARQMGVTTWVAGRFFLKTITRRGVLSVQVAQTREAAEAIFQIVHRFWLHLPDEWKEGPLRLRRSNAGQMVFDELDSEFRVVSASDENAGRGLTIQNLHCSEVARWPGDAGATLAGLRAAMNPGGEMVLESTPNGAYGCFYEGSGMVRHFLPWWWEKRYAAKRVQDFREDELVLMERHGLTAGQIGFRRGLETSYRGLRSQEFAEDAETCFRATGECCFEVSAIEERMAGLGAVREARRGGALQVWLPPMPGKDYVVAVDTAGGGVHGDYAAVQVIEVGSGAQCAELQEKLNTLELARVAAGLAREYRGAVIAVERNNHGAGVLAYLDATERYTAVWRGRDGEPGWLTTAGSKPGAVSRMGALLVETPWLFYSKRLLGECRTYVTFEGGKTGAVAGAHDDCLMAMAVAQAVRAEMLGGRRMR